MGAQTRRDGGRLRIKHVHPRPADLSVVQRFQQRARVHQRAAGQIEQDGLRLHLREAVGVHQMVRFRRGGRVQTEEVGAADDRVQIGEFYAELRGPICRDVGVEG